MRCVITFCACSDRWTALWSGVLHSYRTFAIISISHELLFAFTCSAAVYWDFVGTAIFAWCEEPLGIKIRGSVTLDAVSNLLVPRWRHVFLSCLTSAGPVWQGYEFVIANTLCSIVIRHWVALAPLTPVPTIVIRVCDNCTGIADFTTSRHIVLYI